MKRKFLPLILALVCVVTCTLCLAACDSDNPFSSKAWKMKSEEVTAEQWASALSEDGFKNVKIESTTISEGEYERKDGTKEDIKVTIKTTVIIAEDIQYVKTEATVNKGSQEVKDTAAKLNHEGYSTKNSDGSYTVVYKDEDGNWKQDTSTVGVAYTELSQYLMYGKMYDWFKFQGEEIGYMVDFDSEKMSWDTYQAVSGNRLKFQDGKLVALFGDHVITETIEEEAEDGSTSSTGKDVGRIYQMVTFTYGGQKLTVPAV